MNSYSHASLIYTSDTGHTLWVGDLQAAENVAWLRQKSIRTVITAAAGFKLKYDSSIKHIQYQLVDTKNEGISQYLDIAAFQIMKWLRVGSVLVHCGAGVSRSPSLVIAYLIRYMHMTFKEALKHCKDKRPQVCPNLGFELQLKAYEQKRNSLSKKPEVDLHTSFSNHKSKVLPQLYQSQVEKNFMAKTGFHLRIARQTHHNNNSNLEISTEKIYDRSRELEWLKKLAQFRFGATNMRKWKINGSSYKVTDLNSSKQSN